jgi:hypothetical protein
VDTVETGDTKWTWSQPDPDREGVAGDLSGHFRNQALKNPGIFGLNPPEDDASLLAREAIQNSWDAAIERADNPVADLDLEFKFLELTGDAKSRFNSALGIQELVDRAQGAGGWNAVGFTTKAALSATNNESVPQRVLQITESGTTGMYGPWALDKSKMYLALITVGYTLKQKGAGGSFGLGKAGLLRASATRTVVAYSCFAERPDDPGVTRRLLGINYWKTHNFDGQPHTGWGRFGDQLNAGQTQPFTNEAADEVARSLGIEVRDPTQLDDLGTTFLLLEPNVDPIELLRAIERNWWPAIGDGNGFEVTVVGYNGTENFPKPKTVPELKAFIRAYAIAKTGNAEGNNERHHHCNRATLKTWGNKQVNVGAMGLVADPESWSWPHASAEDEEVKHENLVALVRGPRMVVEYFVPNSQAPYVRGVFLADQDVDDFLRQTEPSLHDSWNTTQHLEGIDPDAPPIAKTILSTIRRKVDEFRKDLRPPAPEKGKFRLTELEKLWKQLFKGGPDVPPPPPGLPPEISINAPPGKQDIHECTHDSSKIQMTAPVNVSLTDHVTDTEVEVMVTISYRFLEDNRAGTAQDSRCSLTVTKMADGFEAHAKRADTYIGSLKRDADPVTFEVESEAYDPDYSGRITINAERLTTELKEALKTEPGDDGAKEADNG